MLVRICANQVQWIQQYLKMKSGDQVSATIPVSIKRTQRKSMSRKHYHNHHIARINTFYIINDVDILSSKIFDVFYLF